MRPKRKAAAAQDRAAFANDSDGESSTLPRCIQCGDHAPRGWDYCRRCHSWSDLWYALRYVETRGIDERRLRRALSYIAPQRRRHPLEHRVAQLARRIAELEAALDI